MTNLQYELFQEDLFETEDRRKVSKVYLEELAGDCRHVASTLGSWEFDCVNNFYRGDLHIHVISDYDHCVGKVTWERKEVFSYLKYWGNLDADEFYAETYTPGPWERIIRELYDESMSEEHSI